MTDEQTQEQQATQEVETTATETFDASSLAAAPAAPEAGDPRDAEIAELKRQLQQERVERGRLGKANDELRQRDEEIARLRAENEKLSARKPSDFLTDDEKKLLDEEQLNAIDKLARGRVNDALAGVKADNERLREQLRLNAESAAASAKARFNAEVERLAPGLAAVVNEHKADWQKWSGDKRRAASVAAAFADNDADTVASFLQEFVEQKGIPTQGDGLAARPQTSFSPRGGSRPAPTKGDQSVYTVDQVNKALRAAADDYAAGKITIEERKAIQKKYDAAYAEGRVVPQ